MTEAYREMLELTKPNYANSFADKNIRSEVWSQLPLPLFAYFDRFSFEADRDKYL
jgi:hypothetical protein